MDTIAAQQHHDLMERIEHERLKLEQNGSNADRALVAQLAAQAQRLIGAESTPDQGRLYLDELLAKPDPCTYMPNFLGEPPS